ncbi:MAG TPA: divergent polysaccharide deacetylase family protein [Alphaproteobacteria bacterium]|nr:divergent polysaccharide deacetylase family protein [Alphaproteobacteria bacterium]
MNEPQSTGEVNRTPVQAQRRTIGALGAAWLALFGVVAGALGLTYLRSHAPIDESPRPLATMRLEWSPRSEIGTAREPPSPRTVEPAAGAIESTAQASPPPASPAMAAAPLPSLPASPPPVEPARTAEPPVKPSAPRQTTSAAVPAAPIAPARIVKLRNVRPFEAKDRRPRIAVVVVELGVKAASSEAAIQRLPPEVTLAFSPFADDLERWTRAAREAGHEVLLTIPLEPTDFPAGGPGSLTLLTSLSPQQNLGRLDAVLKRGVGYVGVTYVMGGRFAASREALLPVLAAIDKRGLMFLDGRANPRSIAGSLAHELGVPRALGDRVIDANPSRPVVEARLAEIEDIARDTGAAVAIAGARPIAFERLSAWLPNLSRKGFALAPISAVVDRQADR